MHDFATKRWARSWFSWISRSHISVVHQVHELNRRVSQEKNTITVVRQVMGELPDNKMLFLSFFACAVTLAGTVYIARGEPAQREALYVDNHNRNNIEEIYCITPDDIAESRCKCEIAPAWWRKTPTATVSSVLGDSLFRNTTFESLQRREVCQTKRTATYKKNTLSFHINHLDSLGPVRIFW